MSIDLSRSQTSAAGLASEEDVSVVSERLFTRSDYIIFILLTCLSGAAIVFFMDYWFSFKDWITHPVSFSLLTFIVVFKVANSIAKWVTLPFIQRPRPIAPRDGLKVGVVTTIVPGAESLEMLEETVRALVALAYPHDTWVLDEGDNQEVKALCRRMGAYHFSRRNLHHYQTTSGTFQVRSKHGNYNAWFHEIGFHRYEIIAAFDPDHVPVPTFLSNVLGFFKDRRVAYVQVAQAYYNQEASFIAKGAAEETYEYYSCTQMSVDNLGEPAIIGCHNTHRVQALREIGGFAAHDADDLLTGMRYQAHGWSGVYLPMILARGLTPVDWDGYLTQQLRWARSVVDIKCRLHKLIDKKLSPVGWILSALHGIFYSQNSITTFLGLLLLAYMLVTGNIPRVVSNDILPRLALLGGALQLCVFYRQRFYLDYRRERGLHLRAALLRYAKWPIFIWAIWDVALGRRVPYALTRKVSATSPAYMLLIPHTLIIVVISAACLAGLILGHSINLLLYGVAAAVVAASLLLILTAQIRFPAPFDKKLLNSQLCGSRTVSSSKSHNLMKATRK